MFQSSLSLASSSTTIAVPVTATQESRAEKVSETDGFCWMARVCAVSRAEMNHISADGSTSWRAIGRLRGPSTPYVVSIAIGMSAIRSTSFFWCSLSVMLARYPIR